MKLKFTLVKSDFLQFQLFQSSCSENVKKRRAKNRKWVPILYLALALILFVQSHIFAALFLILAAVGWWFIYPRYESKRYVNWYSKHLDEHYAGRFNQEVTIDILEDQIEMTDSVGKSTVHLKEVEKILEISTHYFVRLKSGVHIIIPKNQIDSEELNRFINNMTEERSVPLLQDTDWIWK